MMEYAIFIAMVIVTIGFAWLWSSSKRKSERENKRFSTRRSSDSVRKPNSKGVVRLQPIAHYLSAERTPHRSASLISVGA